ncbi:MAG: hypothetical protein WBC22_01350, partial [Sedimentisphaerales bacterium]
QEALAEEPEQETVIINDDPELMEDINEIIYDVTGEGYVTEEYLNLFSEIPGEEAARWDNADWPGNQE